MLLGLLYLIWTTLTLFPYLIILLTNAHTCAPSKMYKASKILIHKHAVSSYIEI